MTVAQSISTHFLNLADHMPELPEGVEWLNPLGEIQESRTIFQIFLEKFYADFQPRHLIMGINPGRFGGGITNVAFTDPLHLEKELGIPSSFPKKSELSAHFVYQVINAYGGPKLFYDQFFVTSVCPFGFVKNGKNYNYYDEKPLQKAATPFIEYHLEALIERCNMNRDQCFCLGEGQNYTFLQQLNAQKGYFQKVVPLSHPRFIMQYKRKSVDLYVEKYLELLGAL
ncbi:SMUG2 DNA glycosylase family protein [Haliscomenobacter hydrossis]|uniref:Uracil-DNA glycosylase-like domain-containing protein n=1 Tax=Haliscomenobacter hydrossis (strain ATCC 27775 / DSM 1100 / LMG 10767 / O) TaxID=760192 RepID=F4KPY9_HALH1|nr:SMUG2 DNA glycosylase family protein [Haliscomenobacter hydrossis]AEE53193.1 hypothetical protein Halhy_5368 [Haliscomenobacter hydrossis DSM 1100]